MASDAYEQLVHAWRSLSYDRPPYVIPEDERIFREYRGEELTHSYSDFEAYIADDDHGKRATGKFHTGVLPDPFVGNLSSAKVFLLMGNPGFTPLDYYAESASPEFKSAKIRNLLQENGDDPFPLFYLDPQFCWHGGGTYWQRKFSAILESSTRTYVETLKLLAQRVAILETLPYHSIEMAFPRQIESRLKSVKLMLNFVREDLLKRARNREILVLSLRGSWGIENEEENIVVYSRTERRAAHLGLSSKGGKKLIEYLQIQMRSASR